MISIPPRADFNIANASTGEIELEFQSLQGLILTLLRSVTAVLPFPFQSLQGLILTIYPPSSVLVQRLFQSLQGLILTISILARCFIAFLISIPPRADFNALRFEGIKNCCCISIPPRADFNALRFEGIKNCCCISIPPRADFNLRTSIMTGCSVENFNPSKG